MSNDLEVSYGVSDLIHIDQIVARTKRRLQLSDVSDYDADIELFINEAAGSLRSKPNFIKKNCRLEIINGKAKIPRGFKKMNGLRMIIDAPVMTADTNTANIFNTTNAFWNQPIYLEQTFLTNCQNEPNSFPSQIPIVGFVPSIEIVGGFINFPIPCPFDACVLSWEGYAISGESCILELHPAYERGFSEYAVYMMLQTYWQINSEDPRRENRVQDALNTWTAQRAMLVSDGFADDAERNKFQFKRMLNALLQFQNNPQ